ncbi:hypothetical protein DUNSADRAFT_10432 [Dunaliella salina]|uniref:GST N-terminal domain-containing protein n=1 Tax=Dunaliella salina TaxID=3046 RepID=A0ABQ7GFE3_DUNSA|nr:hypothetical protein DUNSADRAFT_10432 [Dunaliella salina]|eukprot:KAF5833311.1 hypothetical protein DUNSADRAFT_10432 [Dunaliella salina]
MAPYTLYGMGPRALKVQLVAAFANVEIQKAPFTMGITNKTPWYLKMNPNGKFPLLVTPGGPIFESNAICRFIATHSPQPTGIYPEPSSAEVREQVRHVLKLELYREK